MKKILMTAVVLGCAASFVSAETVSSANVVGYSKVNLVPGFNIVRTPFVAGAQPLELQEIFDTSVLNQGATLGSADSIQFWDMAGLKYDIYFLHDGSGKTGAGKAGKWVDNSTGNIATNVVPPQQGFFFSRSGLTSVNAITAGEVVVAQTGTNSIELLEGFNLIANPFSSEWKLNDGATDWIAQGAVAGATLGSADSIQFWDMAGLKYDVYYLHDGSGKTGAGKAGKWVDNGTSSVDANLSVGLSEGIFYSRQIGAGTATIEIAQPYGL